MTRVTTGASPRGLGVHAHVLGEAYESTGRRRTESTNQGGWAPAFTDRQAGPRATSLKPIL